MAEIPNLRLSLTNSAENVLVVRQALTGAAACLALDAIETNDVNTAVTEACNNVVLHAYEGREGPLEVDLYAVERAIVVVVRDHGRGIHSGEHADTDADAAMTAIGIPVIEALTGDVSFAEPAGGGTEVRMRFDTPNAAALEPLAGDAWDAAGGIPGDPGNATGATLGDPGDAAPGEFAGAVELHADSVELRLAPVAIARAVLPRTLSVLAARAHFSTRRIADVRLIADALAANAGDSLSTSHLDVAIAMAPRNLELRIGPLLRGRGESLMTAAADGLAPVIERLTDAWAPRVARDVGGDGGEMLELSLVDAPSPSGSR
jgi:serine/threonine-protein kinase RsbW